MKPKDKIELVLRAMGVPYIKEHRFSCARKFRFDFCIPDYKIAIEYEGIYFTSKDKEQGRTYSRHTTMSGYSMDTEKYNLATVEGWRVLRYTAKNTHKCHDDIVALIKQINHERQTKINND